MSDLLRLIAVAQKLDFSVESVSRQSITLRPMHGFQMEGLTVTVEDTHGLRPEPLELVLADAGRYYFKRMVEPSDRGREP